MLMNNVQRAHTAKVRCDNLGVLDVKGLRLRQGAAYLRGVDRSTQGMVGFRTGNVSCRQ